MSTFMSVSEKLDYQVQFYIFNCAYKVAKQTNYSRFPAFIALGAGGLACFVAQTVSIAELTLRGLGLVLSSAPPSEKNTRGWKMLKRAPERGISAIHVILVSLANIPIVATDPKFYILSNTVRARVDFDHMQAGTIDSESHDIDSEEAMGKVKSGQITDLALI